MKIYHGSTVIVEKPSLEILNYRTDFGKCFYTTTDIEQAKRWTKIKKGRIQEENKLTGKEVYEIFEKYGVLKYLHDGYDMLHTQGDRWLMNDINEFLKIRGYNG